MTGDNFNGFQIMIENITNSLNRFANIFRQVRECFNNNLDSIANALLIMGDYAIILAATEVLSDNQIVFVDNLSVELATAIRDTDNVENVVMQHYLQNNSELINNLILRCQYSNPIADYQELFAQIIDSYNRRHYQLACIGLFALFDGVLADVEGTVKETRFKPRLESIEKKIGKKIDLDEIDFKTICIFESIKKFDSSIIGFSNFLQEEPDGLNRHWLVHGRTHRHYSQYDFLKILLWLDAIIFLDSVNKNLEELNNTDDTETSC